MLFHNVPRVSMALSSQLAMLNTGRPAGVRPAVEVGEGDGELGPIAPSHGAGIPADDERQWEGAVDYRTKPGRGRMYLTHEAKSHEIPVALRNTVTTGGSNLTGATNSVQRACKPRSVQIGLEYGLEGTVRWYSNFRSV